MQTSLLNVLFFLRFRVTGLVWRRIQPPLVDLHQFLSKCVKNYEQEVFWSDFDR